MDISNTNYKVDNPGIGTNILNIDREANALSLGINIPDKNVKDGRVDYPGRGINTSNTDGKAPNLGTITDIADIDGGANPGICTKIADIDAKERADNPSKRTADADKQMVEIDKVRVFFFSLCKAFFFCLFF